MIIFPFIMTHRQGNSLSPARDMESKANQPNHFLSQLRSCSRILFVLGLMVVLNPTILASPLRSGMVNQDSDSVSAKSFSRRLQEIGDAGYVKNLEEFETTRNQSVQRKVMAEIRRTIQEARKYLSDEVDSIGVENQLSLIKAQRELVEKGVFEGDSVIQSDRNLGVSGAILSELEQKTQAIRDNITDRSDRLFGLSFQIDSLSTIEELFRFSSDSAIAATYAKKFVLIAKEIEPTFNDLHATLATLDRLQASVEAELILIEASILEIQRKRDELNSGMFSTESKWFSRSGFSDLSFGDIIKMSHEKELIAFSLYFEIFSSRIYFLLLVVLLFGFFINNLRVKSKEEGFVESTDSQQLVLKNPLLSALIIVIGVAQFFFPSPPFVFHFFLWMLAALALTVLFFRFLSRYWLGFWLVVLLIFFLSSSLNLVLVFTRVEKMLMLMLSMVGVVYGSLIFLTGKKSELKEKRILYFVGYMVFMQALSFLFCLFGNLNFAKSLLVSGYLGVVLGVILLWTVRLINQMLGLASSLYNKPDKKLFFINFDKIGEKVHPIFYFLLTLGWLILVGRNFYTFNLVSGGFNFFLNTPRVLGSYEFTINGLLIFFVILVISVILSRIVSFFSADPDANTPTTKRKSISLGSWLLLVQIFIISMGLFLAVAASGVPLDKVTIVLGALGVGIGLGLQGLFNNLVSGVIIAFENPVKVGDLIEINGKPGVMKSIGFRSSVVNMLEGASIIIPNGDLLSQQLVNWTMGRGKKVTVVVGVAYGTNLSAACLLVKGLLTSDSRILSYPAPRVLPMDFGDSRIDLEVSFWVNNYLEVPFVKGDIVHQIDVMFKEKGIVIPFPQRDVHLSSDGDNGRGIKP